MAQNGKLEMPNPLRANSEQSAVLPDNKPDQ